MTLGANLSLAAANGGDPLAPGVFKELAAVNRFAEPDMAPKTHYGNLWP
jgi:hypothetical protein